MTIIKTKHAIVRNSDVIRRSSKIGESIGPCIPIKLLQNNRALNLHCNDIESLYIYSDKTFRFDNLLELNLSSNKLGRYCHSRVRRYNENQIHALQILPRLKTLDLAANALGDLSIILNYNSFKPFTKLRNLNLSRNEIKSIKGLSSKFPRLQNLNLCFNRLKLRTITETTSTLMSLVDHLDVLQIEGNPMCSDTTYREIISKTLHMSFDRDRFIGSGQAVQRNPTTMKGQPSHYFENNSQNSQAMCDLGEKEEGFHAINCKKVMLNLPQDPDPRFCLKCRPRQFFYTSSSIGVQTEDNLGRTLFSSAMNRYVQTNEGDKKCIILDAATQVNIAESLKASRDILREKHSQTETYLCYGERSAYVQFLDYISLIIRNHFINRIRCILYRSYMKMRVFSLSEFYQAQLKETRCDNEVVTADMRDLLHRRSVENAELKRCCDGLQEDSKEMKHLFKKQKRHIRDLERKLFETINANEAESTLRKELDSKICILKDQRESLSKELQETKEMNRKLSIEVAHLQAKLSCEKQDFISAKKKFRQINKEKIVTEECAHRLRRALSSERERRQNSESRAKNLQNTIKEEVEKVRNDCQIKNDRIIETVSVLMLLE